MEPAIKTVGLGKIYRTGFWMRPLVGLKSLDLEVHRGEVFGFVGPNGAGKTTTMKIFTGLQNATHGEAFIMGESCTLAKSRKHIGFLPERPYFYVHLTARELLNFYAQLFNVPKAKRNRRISELLERVNMTRFENVPLGKYSKGMLQRVGLCQTLLHEPELIILDEPMSGLDPVGRSLVRDIILDEREKGHTIFFSSHVLSDVQSLCDRVGIIIRGEMNSLGTVDELLGESARFVQIKFTDVPEDFSFSGGTPLPTAGPYQAVRVPIEHSNECGRAIYAAGGNLIEMTPERVTLEELLVDEIVQEQEINHKQMGVLA